MQLPRVLLLGALLYAPLALASEITRVNDAGAKDNPIDIDIKSILTITAERANITREGPGAPGGPLPTSPDTVYRRQRTSLMLATEIGLARDFSFFGVLPLVLSDVQRLERADGVALSTLEEEQLVNTTLPGEVNRSGLGDATLGLSFGLMNQERDPTKPFWVTRLALRLPTGAPMQAGSTGVGEGVLGALAQLAFSKRFGRLDPFFALEYRYFHEVGEDTLFRDVGKGQSSIRPGQEGEVRAGLEVIVRETSFDDKIALALGGSVGFVSLGRGYTPLFDFLAEQNPDGPLHGVNLQGESDPDVAFDGLLEEEQHGFGTLDFGAYVRKKVFTLSASVRYQKIFSHFLSFGSAGVDVNGNGVVDDPETEANPFFQPLIDLPGARLRAEGAGAWSFVLNAGFAF